MSKLSKLKLFLNIFVVMIIIFAGANYAEAQKFCQKCKANAVTRSFDCVSSNNGGIYCNVTNGGKSCSVEIGCATVPVQEITQLAEINSRYLIKFDPRLIRNIAQKQPRLAATLVNLHKQGTFGNGSTISWIGDDFEYKDLEYLLNQITIPSKNNTPSNYFKPNATNNEADVSVVDHSISVMASNYKEVSIVISSVDSKGTENNTLTLRTKIIDISKQSGIDVLSLTITNWELK
ncbi:MAG: hypothetical protein WAQ98_25070 [Blastocatellia bacterium]